MNTDGTLPTVLNGLIEDHGVPLNIESTEGIGFRRSHAEKALDIFAENQVTAVLGGDVYWVHERRVVISPDHWACDPQPAEPWQHYVQRSVEFARRYLRRYKCPSDTEDCLFVFVVETR